VRETERRNASVSCDHRAKEMADRPDLQASRCLPEEAPPRSFDTSQAQQCGMKPND
jgi:hypothetical protein